MSKLRVGAIQMNSGADVAKNLQDARNLLQRAAAEGARLAVLPENFAAMRPGESYRAELAEREGDGLIQSALAAAAAQCSMWVVGGTLPIVAADAERPYASCLIFDDNGNQRGRYDKIHLFDVGVPGRDESYRESSNTTPGSSPVIIETPWGGLGVGVCYDLRFPEMFRHRTEKQPGLLAVPAAFTYSTGRVHWQVLLRARAIENLSFVVAAAQTGRHPGGRRTFGHSMIIGPWGETIAAADAQAGEDVIVADLDIEQPGKIRERFPALVHRRFTVNKPD